MKRQYSKPNMSVEMFEANEYIASGCVKINCKKPPLSSGVYYYNNPESKDIGYQDPKLYKKPDEALTICWESVDVKIDSITREDNLYYDYNGTIVGGKVVSAYHGVDKDGEVHYFINMPDLTNPTSLAS